MIGPKDSKSSFIFLLSTFVTIQWYPNLRHLIKNVCFCLTFVKIWKQCDNENWRLVMQRKKSPNSAAPLVFMELYNNFNKVIVQLSNPQFYSFGSLSELSLFSSNMQWKRMYNPLYITCLAPNNIQGPKTAERVNIGHKHKLKWMIMLLWVWYVIFVHKTCLHCSQVAKNTSYCWFKNEFQDINNKIGFRKKVSVMFEDYFRWWQHWEIC